MASGFVPGGTINRPIERDDEWLRAELELEEERKRKAELGKQQDGKSLYDVLQENKAKKQEAFEESIRLKNQFRTLDEDDAEFLDSVLESTRAREAAVRKETVEQLGHFHRQRQEAERDSLAKDDPTTSAVSAGDDNWMTAGRKRRRPKAKDTFPGMKLRKSSSTEPKLVEKGQPANDDRHDKQSIATTSTSVEELRKSSDVKDCPGKQNKETKNDESRQAPAKSPSSAQKSSVALGLSAYSSDEE